jgi:hypothetical protein
MSAHPSRHCNSESESQVMTDSPARQILPWVITAYAYHARLLLKAADHGLVVNTVGESPDAE